MKKFIFIFIIYFPVFSFSQISKDLLKSNLPLIDDKVRYEGIVETNPQIKATDIYKKARLWIVDSFYSAKDALQLEDKDNNILIAKGFFDIAHNNAVSGKCWFTLKIETKDGKYRFTLYDIIYNWKVAQFEMNDPIESWIPGTGFIKLKEKDFEKPRFKEMINDFYKSINDECIKTLESLHIAIEKQESNW